MQDKTLILPHDLAHKGWVIRKGDINSNPILVRGARHSGDGYLEWRKGFVYAETIEEARKYDSDHNY